MQDQYQDSSQFTTNDEAGVRLLYRNLLESWNKNNADDYAACFTGDANVTGFDGSQMNGKQSIRQQIGEIFAHHKVAAYVSIVREIRVLSPTVFLLRAVAGMVPPGGKEINAAVNAIQTLIAVKENGALRIAVFQNTPAAFHGRPELARQLTGELQQAWDENKNTF